MRRLLGIFFGLGVQVLFVWTAWRLFGFLKGAQSPSAAAGDLWVDGLLSLQFAVPHSVLLLPRVRKRLTSIVPDAFYGCMHCAVTCISLLILFARWRSSPIVVWHAIGFLRRAIEAAFLASWAALVYSLNLTGLGFQTGWTPWWDWVRRRPLTRRSFKPRSAYLWLRHPVYLSFLGLIWFAPLMTLDHALLTAIWTVYIFFGSWLKDRRLTFYLGDRYRKYEAVVPGYPGLRFGPLGRIAPLSDSANVSNIATSRSPLSRRAA